MPVSAIIVEVNPEKTEKVADKIRFIKGAEVQESAAGYIIATTDTQTAEEDQQVLKSIHDLPDVIVANVVFSHMADIVE